MCVFTIQMGCTAVADTSAQELPAQVRAVTHHIRCLIARGQASSQLRQAMLKHTLREGCFIHKSKSSMNICMVDDGLRE